MTECDSTDLRKWFEQASQVEAGGITFHAGGERKDDFVDLVCCNPFHEVADLQHFRTDAVHRRDQASQNVVSTGIFPGAFEGQ